MARRDEILLPDGRRLPFRRTPVTEIGVRTAHDVVPSAETASHPRDRRRVVRGREQSGRVIDLEA